MKTTNFILALLLNTVLFDVTAQGCSDAGICTMGDFKPRTIFSFETPKPLKNTFKIGAFKGKADYGIQVNGLYLEYNRQMNTKWGFNIKISSLGQYGNGIAVFGLSDLYFNTHYTTSKQIKWILGAKVPLTDSNRKLNGLSLPMDYQASLGTFDLVFGLGYSWQNIQFVVALQQPLTQNNNQFIASTHSNSSAIQGIQSTNNFKRSGDLMFRISYPIPLGQRFNFTASLLPIYHLQADRYTDANNIERTIKGSAGLTVNSNLFLDYHLNDKNSLQLNLAFPIAVRAARPDGLTRSALLNLEYQIRF